MTSLSFAQEKKVSTSKYRLGFKVSPNISWLASDNSNMTVGDKSLQFGYGLNFDIFFADHYAIGTGFNINNTGGKYSYFAEYTGDDIDATGTAITNMNQVGLISRDLRLQYVEHLNVLRLDILQAIDDGALKFLDIFRCAGLGIVHAMLLKE